MTNLAISGVCDLGCPFCFAGGHLAASRDQGSAYVDAAVFERWLDLLERSGIPEARPIGGEPTLHPAFADLVARAQRRGLAVHVFTHGLMPERALDCLAALPVEACSVLVNMNAGRSPDPSPRELARRQMTMRRLGQRAIARFHHLPARFRSGGSAADHQRNRLPSRHPAGSGATYVGRRQRLLAPQAVSRGRRPDRNIRPGRRGRWGIASVRLRLCALHVFGRGV